MILAKTFGLALVRIGLTVGGTLAQDNKLEFFPIALRCPAENNAILELISANRLGIFERIGVAYKGDKASAVSFDVRSGNSAFGEYLIYDLAKITDPTWKDAAKKLEIIGDKLMQNICLGSEEERRRYYTSLAANRAKLGLR